MKYKPVDAIFVAAFYTEPVIHVNPEDCAVPWMRPTTLA